MQRDMTVIQLKSRTWVPLVALLLLGLSPNTSRATSSPETTSATNTTASTIISLGLVWDSIEGGTNFTDMSATLLASIQKQCPSSPRVNGTQLQYGAFTLDTLPKNKELKHVVDALSLQNFLFFGIKQNSVTQILESLVVPTSLVEYPLMKPQIVAPMPQSLLLDAIMKVIRRRVSESQYPLDASNFRGALFLDSSVSVTNLSPLITYFKEAFIYFTFNSSTVEADLLSVKSAQITNVIVIMIDSVQGRILRDVAFSLNMFSARYRWFVHGPRLINEVSDIGVNILSKNVTSIEFGRINDALIQGIWSTTGAFVHDLLSIWRPYLKNYICREGLSINQTLFGFTGSFKRAPDGSASRLTWQLGIFSGLGSNREQVGEWSSDGRFDMLPRPDTTRGIDELLADLRANNFRVETAIYPPYVQFIPGKTNCSAPCRNELTGMYIEICKLLLQNLGINDYEFRLNVGIGLYNSTEKRWNGVIKTVMDGKALLGCVPVTINTDRFKVVDFTQIIHSSRVSLLLRQKAGDPMSQVFQFIMPLNYKIWISILGVLILVALCLFVINKIVPDDSASYDMYNSLFFAFAEVVQGTGGATPTRVSGRILVTFFWFFTLFLFLSYIANYAVFRTLDGVKQEVTSIDSLIQNRDYDCGSLAYTVTDSLLQQSAYPNMQQLYLMMSEIFPNGRVANIDAAISLINDRTRNFVLINDNLQNQYYRDMGCDLTSTGDFYDLKNSMILPKGSDFGDLIDSILTNMTANISALQTKFFTATASKTCYDGSLSSAIRYYIPKDAWPTKTGALTLTDTLGIAIINLVGCCIAIALAGVEKAIGKWQSRRSTSRRQDQLSKPIVNKFKRPTSE